jgi:hypothetical protein
VCTHIYIFFFFPPHLYLLFRTKPFAHLFAMNTNLNLK